MQAAREDFWDAKDPAAWTQEEKQTLLDNSPWAREGFVRMELDKKKVKGNERKGAQIPYTRPDQIPNSSHSYPYGEKPPPVPNTDPGRPVQFRLLARWETAKPVRLAGGPEVPEATGEFYVLRLRGLPLLAPRKPKRGETSPPPNPNEGLLEAIKAGTQLERTNKPSIPCAHLFTGSGEAVNEVLLFFPKGNDPITVAEKTVTVEGWFASFHLLVTFPLKSMTYKGELSL